MHCALSAVFFLCCDLLGFLLELSLAILPIMHHRDVLLKANFAICLTANKDRTSSLGKKKKTTQYKKDTRRLVAALPPIPIPILHHQSNNAELVPESSRGMWVEFYCPNEQAGQDPIG